MIEGRGRDREEKTLWLICLKRSGQVVGLGSSALAHIPLPCVWSYSTVTKSGHCGIALRYRGYSLMVKRWLSNSSLTILRWAFYTLTPLRDGGCAGDSYSPFLWHCCLSSFPPSPDRAQIRDYHAVPRCIHAVLLFHASYQTQGTVGSAVSWPLGRERKALCGVGTLTTYVHGFPYLLHPHMSLLSCFLHPWPSSLFSGWQKLWAVCHSESWTTMCGHWCLSYAAMMRLARMSKFPMYDTPSADSPVPKRFTFGSLLVVAKHVPSQALSFTSFRELFLWLLSTV